MKCRKVFKNENGTHGIVFFGSSGLILPKYIYFGIDNIINIDESKTINGIKVNKDNFELIKNYLTITINEIDINNKKIKFNLISSDVSKLPDKINLTVKYFSEIFNYQSLNENRHSSLNLMINSKEDLKNGVAKEYEIDLLMNAKVISDYKNKKIYNITWMDNPNYNNGIDNSYNSNKDSIVDSLIQRLSIIKGELWYQINYGIPLFDKINNNNIFDSAIIKIILSHPAVKNIESFNSKIVNNQFQFNTVINTIYNESLNLSNVIEY